MARKGPFQPGFVNHRGDVIRPDDPDYLALRVEHMEHQHRALMAAVVHLQEHLHQRDGLEPVWPADSYRYEDLLPPE